MNKQKLSVITLLIITLSMLGVSATQAQNIQDSTICYGYDSNLQPKGVGNTIFQYTEKVGLWVQIQNPTEVAYRIIWKDPSGSQFRNTAVTVVDKSGEDWGIVFDSINIAESTATNKLGVWTVSLYIDGEVEVEREFQIISYQNLIDNIQDIQDQIQDIVDEKDALLAQNAALEASLQILQADYQVLQAQVGTASGYQELQDNYDELSADYDALKTSQGTTRTMMYAAIVVALVAVVVAVYFGAIKK
jgi:hypothetical protein